MDATFITEFLAGGEWLLSLYAFIGVLAVMGAGRVMVRLVPAFRQTAALNKEVADKQVQKSFYMPIQRRSMKWGLIIQTAVFVAIIPFVVTSEAQPWWHIPLDIFVILMFYDFFYYLTHRFVFHDGGFGPGPLMWVHAVHHQQKNPCRKDSNYLHPLETSIGIGLFGVSIAVLGALMGPFHIATVIITWVAFSEINQHNHDRMEVDRFPFKYLNYMSFMHHVHHSRFTSGNFATISLFYDWLFGTYDVGDGWGKNKREPQQSKPQQKPAPAPQQQAA
ncbi:sterol desaturase family protein [Haliea sp. E17]|uniref:sterol desaturase family protein n=1 Tax=Haliea sp. E17 TaxID=3401576 RepID=UPI003AAFEC6C